jgi:hypothetical protein
MENSKYKKLNSKSAKTSSGKLKTCKFILHVVCVRWMNGKKGEEKNLQDSIESCLDEIEKLKMQSATIPCFPSEHFGFPKEVSVNTLWNTTLNWFEFHKDSTLKQVYFASEDDEILHMFSNCQSKRGMKRKSKDEEQEVSLPPAKKKMDSPRKKVQYDSMTMTQVDDGMTMTQVDDGMTLTQVDDGYDFPTKNYEFVSMASKSSTKLEFKKIIQMPEENSQPIFKNYTKNTQMDE